MRSFMDNFCILIFQESTRRVLSYRETCRVFFAAYYQMFYQTTNRQIGDNERDPVDTKLSQIQYVYCWCFIGSSFDG